MGFGQGIISGRGFKGNCNYCHKFGHKSANCIKRKNDLEGRGNNNGIGRRQETADVSLIALEMEIAFMAEEMELEYCVYCGGRGPLGTYCDRCVDSGCIYARELFENEERGDYWEQCNDEEEEDKDDKMNDDDIIEENKHESNDKEEEESKVDREFEQ
jgi:hypothetical protein